MKTKFNLKSSSIGSGKDKYDNIRTGIKQFFPFSSCYTFREIPIFPEEVTKRNQKLIIILKTFQMIL